MRSVSNTGWTHPSLQFSHPDYPKLIPAIAAQLAYLKGYWNEFLPKGSLLVMLVPLSLWVFSFRQKSATFILLVLMFFFSLGAAWLTNGYMDGYLAGYCGVALLSFGRYLSERRDTDLYSGVCALGIAASIKNEGLLFGLCLVAALLVIGATHSRMDPQPVGEAHPNGPAVGDCPDPRRLHRRSCGPFTRTPGAFTTIWRAIRRRRDRGSRPGSSTGSLRSMFSTT